MEAKNTASAQEIPSQKDGSKGKKNSKEEMEVKVSVDSSQSVMSNVTNTGELNVSIGNVDQSIKNEFNHYHDQEEGNFSKRQSLSYYLNPYFPDFDI